MGRRNKRSFASIGAGILSSGGSTLGHSITGAGVSSAEGKAGIAGTGAGVQSASQSSSTAGTGGGGFLSRYTGDGELSDVQIAEAESAGMDTSGMSREEYDAGSQSFGLEQNYATAEEQVRNENSNPASSAGQQAYTAQAQERLAKFNKKSQHTAGAVNSQIRNQRIVDDAANHRKER